MMNILEFFFSIFKECFRVLNVDIFGLGFTWLEFLLGSILIIIIIRFVTGIVGVGDSIDLSHIVYGLKVQDEHLNAKRERQVSKEHKENKSKIKKEDVYW